MALFRVASDIFNVEKYRDLEIPVNGQSRSLKVVPCDILYMVSCQCSIVTLPLRCTIFEVFDFKNAVTLKIGLGSVKVIGNATIR